MPTLALTLTGANGTAHDWNQVSTPFTEIQTFLNTTKLDYNNIQTNGIRATQVRSIANISGGRAKVRNNTGAEVAASSIVGYSGTYSDGTNNYPTIVKADSAAEASWIPARGILLETTANNADGTIATEYELSGVNTSSKSVHDPVYLSETAGAWTLTAPTGDSIIQIIGFVSVSHASTGRIVFSFPGIVLPYGISSTGNLTTKGTLTVGVNDAGHDVTFYGDTDTKKWVWDTSADKMIITGEASVSGELAAGSLDIEGNVDVNGILEADAYTVDGTALNEYIADTIGAMVTSNTETNIAVTYDDADNTLDFVVDLTGAATATNVTVSANNSGDEDIFPTFVDGATGAQGIETDTGFTYNPSSGTLTITGELDAGSLDISGSADIDGTLEADAITIDGAAIATVLSPVAGHSSIATVGALNSGSITSGFGTIDTGSSTITTTGVVTGGGFTIGSAVIGEAELEILDGATVTTDELNLIDGGTSRGTDAVASGDGILINDGGTMKMTNVDTVSTYFASHNVGGSNIATVGTVTSGTFSGVLDGSVTMTQGSDATGDMYYRAATTGYLTRLPAGADGLVLTGTGAGSIPAWEAVASSSTVTLADGSVSAPSLTNTGDTNQGLYFPGTDIMGVTTAGEERMRFGSDGTVYIGNDIPSNNEMGDGLIIKTTSDQNGLALYDDEVDHSFESQNSETDMYGHFRKTSDAIGGLRIRGFMENTNAQHTMIFQAFGGQADTTKSTGGNGGLICFQAYEHDGSGGYDDTTADGVVFSIATRVGGSGLSIFMVDEDGDIFYDGSAASMDTFDDAQLIRCMSLETTKDPKTIVRSRWDDMVKYKKDDLVSAGLLGAVSPEDEAKGHRGLVNACQMQRLFMGAHWQAYEDRAEMRETIESLQGRLTEAETTIKRLT